MRTIILASTSPRRHDLLSKMGVTFNTAVPDADETIDKEASPKELAAELARRKALSVCGQYENAIIIGADTLVFSADGQIIGKPADAEDAKRILHNLSGTTHSVITGVCVIDTSTGRELLNADETQVTMKKMTDAEIDDYVASGEALGKAGAYAIQETGDAYVKKTEGSFNNVVGLPTEMLKKMLTELGWTD